MKIEKMEIKKLIDQNILATIVKDFLLINIQLLHKNVWLFFKNGQ